MKEVQRYNSVAISLHWLIALFILGLLAMGKYMTHLEVDDPLRYTLTQWHKSFGITVLFLALFRVIWRFTHRPPALPDGTHRFEKLGSRLTHFALYLLMVVIPVSGWVMVSASPLNLETLLFGVIPWPHISYFTSLPEREQIAEQSALLHLWLGNITLLLVMLHTVAALFHQWVHKDNLISRMVVSDVHRKSGDLSHALVPGLLLAAAGGLFLTVSLNSQGVIPSAANNSEDPSGGSDVPSTVGFTATQSGDLLAGEFTDVKVELSLDEQAIESSTLSATVMTGSVFSNDAQLDATMVTSDWFASEEFPQATFQSSSFEKTGDTIYTVTGELSIRGNTHTVEFDLVLEDAVGHGEFIINRTDYGIGDGGQDEFVDQEVLLRFKVRNSS